MIELQPSETSSSAFAPLLTDNELANILAVTGPWIRAHAHEIPGFERLGSYYRFRRSDIDHWLGGLDPLFESQRVAAILNVPLSWVYANADSIPGVLRLGRYVRFRPAELNRFLAASSVAQ